MGLKSGLAALSDFIKSTFLSWAYSRLVHFTHVQDLGLWDFKWPADSVTRHSNLMPLASPMAVPAALLPVPRKPSRAAMATQETVAFQSSLPENGRTNPDSRKRSFPTDSSAAEVVT
jgi:hypothetical protein